MTASGVLNAIGLFSNATSQIAGGVASIPQLIYDQVSQITNREKDLGIAVSNFSRKIGTSNAEMDRIISDTIRSFHDNKLAAKYNISEDEYIKQLTAYNVNVGRAINVSEDDQETLIGLSKVMGDQASQFAANLENFGVALPQAGETATSMFKDAVKSGISFEKYSKAFLENIKMAQKYTFKDGLKGLEAMAKKSVELGLNMQEAANFAEKITGNGLEGAIETAARMQVLGGPFASIADPLNLLNKSLNDLGSLQDDIIKSVRGLGSYSRGEVNFSAFDKQRIKGYAQAAGMNYEDLMNSAQRSVIRDRIGSAINNVGGLEGREDLKELIKNIGVIRYDEETGKETVGANVNGKFRSIDEIVANNELQEQLVKLQQTEGENIAEIAYNTRSIYDVVEGVATQIENEFRYLYQGIGGSNVFSKARNLGLSTIDYLGKNSYTVANVQGYSSLISQGAGILGNGATKLSGIVAKHADGGFIDNMSTPSYGILSGPSHSDGGINLGYSHGVSIEAEGGEGVFRAGDGITSIIPKKSMGMEETIPILNELINSKYTGRDYALKNIGRIAIGSNYDNSVKKINEYDLTPSSLIDTLSAPVPFKIAQDSTQISASKIIDRGDSNGENVNYKGNNNSELTFKPIDININGKIGLETNRGNYDISDLILNDRGLIRQITNLINDTIKEQMTGQYGSVHF